MIVNFFQTIFGSLPGNEENIRYFSYIVWLSVLVDLSMLSTGLMFQAIGTFEKVAICTGDELFSDWVVSNACTYKYLYIDDTMKFLRSDKDRQRLYKPGLAHAQLNLEKAQLLGHWETFPMLWLVLAFTSLVPLFTFRMRKERNTIVHVLGLWKLKEAYKREDVACDLIAKVVKDMIKTVSYHSGTKYARAHAKTEFVMMVASLVQMCALHIMLGWYEGFLGYELWATKGTPEDLGLWLFPRGEELLMSVKVVQKCKCKMYVSFSEAKCRLSMTGASGGVVTHTKVCQIK